VIEIKNIDPAKPFLTQLQEADPGPVAVINTFVYPERKIAMPGVCVA
jgi:hypothetical protein